MNKFQKLLWLILAALMLSLASLLAQSVAVTVVGMTVSDMDRALAFYTEVLSFRKISDVEVYGPEYEQLLGVFGARIRVARLQLGDEIIELTDFLAPEGRPIPVDSRSNDGWFQHIAIVVSDMEKAYQQLRSFNVQHVSTHPQRLPDWNKAAAGIEAFYFRDPDGHNLEIIYFPPGKGEARWQDKSRLFLGIDHTAIGVANTEASLKFYRDVLGMHVAGTSENYGAEQEYLNNVFGAHLLITGLRAGSPVGPGIEFLDYLTPTDGRPYPRDARANDLLHWQTTLSVTSIAEVLQKMIQSGQTGAELVSPGVVEFADSPLGLTKALMVRDPDGHALLFVEENNKLTEQ